MAKYESTVVLKVAGKPDTTAHCSFPDEKTFQAAKKAFRKSVLDVDDYRDANPHDKAVAAGGPTHVVTLDVTVTRDGKPHFGPASLPTHDVPAAVLTEIEKSFAALLKHPHVAACLKS